MSYAVTSYLDSRLARRNLGRVKSPVATESMRCSRKECNGLIAWAIYRWGQRRNGQRVRRGVRFVCDFHAASIPEDTNGTP